MRRIGLRTAFRPRSRATRLARSGAGPSTRMSPDGKARGRSRAATAAAAEPCCPFAWCRFRPAPQDVLRERFVRGENARTRRRGLRARHGEGCGQGEHRDGESDHGVRLLNTPEAWCQRHEHAAAHNSVGRLPRADRIVPAASPALPPGARPCQNLASVPDKGEAMSPTRRDFLKTTAAATASLALQRSRRARVAAQTLAAPERRSAGARTGQRRAGRGAIGGRVVRRRARGPLSPPERRRRASATSPASATTSPTASGVRVLVDGSWGFAATSQMRRAGAQQAALSAVVLAKAARAVRRHRVELAPVDARARHLDHARAQGSDRRPGRGEDRAAPRRPTRRR